MVGTTTSVRYSRGIPPEVAEQLLVEAFFREVIDRLPDGIDKDALAERILAKIGALA